MLWKRVSALSWDLLSFFVSLEGTLTGVGPLSDAGGTPGKGADRSLCSRQTHAGYRSLHKPTYWCTDWLWLARLDGIQPRAGTSACCREGCALAPTPALFPQDLKPFSQGGCWLSSAFLSAFARCFSRLVVRRPPEPCWVTSRASFSGPFL